MEQKWIDKIIGKEIDLCQDEIRVRNYDSFQRFSRAGTVISLLVCLLGMALSKVIHCSGSFMFVFLYFIFLCILSQTLAKKYMKYITLIFYLALEPLMVLAILLGTFMDPTEPSVTIMIFLCALTIFIIDKPWKTLLYITIHAGIYLVSCYFAKSQELFVKDVFDLFTFYLLAMSVNYFTLLSRIDSVRNYIQFRDKSEKDPLTGLNNRGAGFAKIETLIREGKYGAFIVVDVDDLKAINDCYGHLMGDSCLREVAKKLKDNFRENDVVLRFGGDEFAVYAIGLLKKEQCEKRFKEFYEQLHSIKMESAEGMKLSVSLGCVICDDSNYDFEEIYKLCDDYMYDAKKSGKGHYKIMEEKLQTEC